ncbi:MAG TPA: hypothetical protein PKJ85_07975, partial [Nitrosomonas nitrosa]|nr:hypothetical protein [Nitrosomonas nitrosa]
NRNVKSSVKMLIYPKLWHFCFHPNVGANDNQEETDTAYVQLTSSLCCTVYRLFYCSPSLSLLPAYLIQSGNFYNTTFMTIFID